MERLKTLIVYFLSTPGTVFAFLLFICVFSLAAAFFAEGFLGLEPCHLCVTQRYPFAVGAIIGMVGLAKRRNLPFSIGLLALSSLNYLTNAGIAFYHTGVERHWWESTELCKLPDFEAKGQTLIENILSTPGGRCDQIPWADPLLGLSMANYNVILCAGLAALCALSALLIRKTLNTEAA
jgi:disulfide bond formation protein DsbB